MKLFMLADTQLQSRTFTSYKVFATYLGALESPVSPVHRDDLAIYMSDTLRYVNTDGEKEKNGALVCVCVCYSNFI